MIFNELLEHIINTEERAGLIYESIAELNDGEIKTIAMNFAKQERHHKEMIKKFIEEADELSQEVSENAYLLLNSYEKNQKETVIKKVDTTRKELFKLALQMEKDSINIYEEIIRLFALEGLSKDYFEKLIKEERGHMYYILKQLHDMK